MSNSKTLGDVGKTHIVKNQKLFHMSSDDFLTEHFRMTFIGLCNENNVDVALAVENNNIAVACDNRDIEEVERVLKEEF